jgi:hypothetical protein
LREPPTRFVWFCTPKSYKHSHTGQQLTLSTMIIWHVQALSPICFPKRGCSTSIQLLFQV